jgi:hypothetical protein
MGLSSQFASPRRRGQLCAAPSRASAARAALRDDCARRLLLSGARRCALRCAGAASAPAPYRGQTRHRPRDLRATEAPGPDRPESEPVCVCEGKSRSVCQVRRNIDIVGPLFDQHFFTASQWGRRVAVGMEHARCLRRRPSLRAPALAPRRPRHPHLCCPRRAPSLGPRPSLLHLPRPQA